VCIQDTLLKVTAVGLEVQVSLVKAMTAAWATGHTTRVVAVVLAVRVLVREVSRMVVLVSRTISLAITTGSVAAVAVQATALAVVMAVTVVAVQEPLLEVHTR
jgi:hypothetical protein